MKNVKTMHGGKRANSGRKKKEETISTGFRINAESLIKCRTNKVPLNSKINQFVIRIANEFD
jgi:hypothetical protein